MRVVVLDDYQNAARQFGEWSGIPDLDLVSLPEHIADEASLAEKLAGAQVVVAMRERTRMPASLFDRLTGVELVVTTGLSNAVIDIAAASARGITVCGTSGIITPTSELTWGLIHAVTRHIAADDATMRSGGWQTRMGTGLAGSRLGLVGLGNIGARVAAVGLAFGMDVVAWSQNLSPEKAEAVGVRPVSKDELLSTSDVVSVHYQLSERSRGIVGAADFARMKRSAVIVNTSRGPLIDRDALIDALRNGTIAGAGLDVYDLEPLAVADPLRSLPNTVLTPHTGYVVDQCYEIFFEHIVEDILMWQAGTPVRVVAPPTAQTPPAH
ncbi:MAG: D-2-hydroxyacid dehydrogenase family protein [Thermoleophilia bacterium]